MSDWDKGFDAYFGNLDRTKPAYLPPDSIKDWFAYREWRRGEQTARAYVSAIAGKPFNELRR